MSESASSLPSSSGDMAVIGEGTPDRTPVSIQVLQQIYHELTGKSEEVSKSYDEAFHINANDFKQLNHKIGQTCEQYNIQAENCSVKVFYINDTKDTFSSFARFEAFNAGSSNAIESVLLTYNFLIILPKVSEPQSYTVTIRVTSPVAIQRKMRTQFFSMPKIFKLMGGARTAVVSIKYVDYSVARTVLNTIDEWFIALPQSRPGMLMKFLRRHTDYFRLIARYLAGLVAATVIVGNISVLLPTSPSLPDLAKFLILTFVSIFAAYKLADHVASAAEDSLDCMTDISYICITDGDKKELELAKDRNRSSLIWGTGKLVLSLLVSVASKLIVVAIISFLA